MTYYVDLIGKNDIGRSMDVTSNVKVSWQGRLLSIQPRIRLMRSFDERSHTYLGYSLRLRGKIDRREGDFLVGIGKAAQAKHEFRTGDLISGVSKAVTDSREERMLMPFRAEQRALHDMFQHYARSLIFPSILS